ncbi:sensor histidine kinase [Brevibacterium spongiae]|uniref:histidine kinase n=1 Tax=Brevibacterium spongiae TaxID=2909672 RepID=A0ABY5SSW3_9MICO|nr:sensor histidine kinase [Brevibacterium spongiae]UVI36971.1 sensor histidine kinase [Brevibacterium spongiae]
MTPERRDRRERGNADSRRAPRRLVLLTVAALVLQLPFALWVALQAETAPSASTVRIGAAVVSPALFFLMARWAGPRVAALAALTLLDILVWAAVSPSISIGGIDHGPGNGPWGERGPWAPALAGEELTPFYAAFLFSVVAAMARGRQLWAIASAAGVWAGSLLLGPVLGIDWSVGRVVSATMGLAIAVGIGAFVRRRRELGRQAEAEQQARHAEVIQAERLRIARDLHDVLGHALSQINVQAGVGEHLIDRDPAQARSALAAIRELSRTGLNEVRTVLHTMRSDTGTPAAPGSAPFAPVHGIDDVPALVARLAGSTEIRLNDRRSTDATGAPEKPGQSTDAAAFRIIQEALTNISRHAQADTAQITIERRAGRLQVTISDDGTGMSTSAEGAGILGMRERAKLLGGTLGIASAGEGGTVVSVDLPWSADDADAPAAPEPPGTPETPGDEAQA